jgi:hypothetical protein
MHVGIPEFQQSLPLEPFLANQQAKHNTSRVIIVGRAGSAVLASFAGSFDDSRGDNIGMSGGDPILFELTGNDLLDLMFEAQSDFCDFSGGDGARDVVAVGWQQSAGFVDHASSTVAVAVEH